MLDLNKYLRIEQDEFSDRPVKLTSGPFLDYLVDCSSILDVGCGTGRLVKYFIDMGKKNVAGITFDKTEIRFGVKNFELREDVHLFLGDMHEMPFDDNSFDAIVSWDSLEHSPAPYVALCEMYRVLIPGGKALIYIPDTEWIDYQDHYIVMNTAQMRHLAKMAGFKVEEVITRGKEDGVYKLMKI